MDRMAKSVRKKLVKTLDKVFSLYIRKRDSIENDGKCVFCRKPIQHCFHFITRAKYATRWNEINAVGSCAGCNFENEFNPHKFIQWFLKKYGLKMYEDLIYESNLVHKFEPDDLSHMIEKYQQHYEALSYNKLGDK
jgi:hypothetical protein